MVKAYTPIPPEKVRLKQHKLNQKKVQHLKINAPVIVSTLVSLTTIIGLLYIIILGIQNPTMLNQVVIF